jgi:hypothetical protein
VERGCVGILVRQRLLHPHYDWDSCGSFGYGYGYGFDLACVFHYNDCHKSARKKRYWWNRNWTSQSPTTCRSTGQRGVEP